MVRVGNRRGRHDGGQRGRRLGADAVFLCVKPADARAALRAVAPSLRATLLVSVAAGVKLDDLQEETGLGTPIIRTMPNTPCLVGKGAIAYARGESARPMNTLPSWNASSPPSARFMPCRRNSSTPSTV